MKFVLTELKIIFSDKESVVVPVRYILSPGVRGIKESFRSERFSQCKDLVGIEPKYSDGTSEEIYLPLEDGCDTYTNDLQKTSFDGYGNLVIEVQQDWNKTD